MGGKTPISSNASHPAPLPEHTSGGAVPTHSMTGQVDARHSSNLVFSYADADFPALGAWRESNSGRTNGDGNHTSMSGGEHQDDSMNLEERLRGMILRNAAAQTPTTHNVGHIIPTSTALPPHMQTASSLEKDAYFLMQQRRQHQGSVSSPPHQSMSQAQRRQPFPDSRFSAPYPVYHPPGNMPAAAGDHIPPLGTATAPIQPFPQYPFGGSIQPFPQQFATPQISSFPHGQIPGPSHMPYDPRRMNMQPGFNPQSQVPHQMSLKSSSHNTASNHAVLNSYQADIIKQCEQLEQLALEAVNQVAIDDQEVQEKDAFRAIVEKVCREAIQENELQATSGDGRFDVNAVQLKSFGSLVTGFAVKNSDMDLMLLSPQSRLPLSSSESPIPRILENRFLEMGWGAQLLTRTRVPIIKLCERPSEDLLLSLKSQREKREADVERANVDESHLEDPVHPEADETKQAVSTASEVKPPRAHEGPLVASAADLATLTQTNTEDIWRYYRKARNIFGRLDNYNRRFPFHQRRNAERQTVAVLTEGFISGLRDETLKRRVRLHKSFTAETHSSYFRNVLQHVSGEEVVMAWEGRSIKEKTEAKEAEGAAVVQSWRELHEHTVVNNAQTEKMLSGICDKLRSLPSAQLEMFSQTFDETPEGYYQRFRWILKGLKYNDLMDRPPSSHPPHVHKVLLALLERFVNGVNDENIRSQLSLFMEERDLPLPQLHAQHLAERRIKRFEMGIKKGFYSPDDQQVVDECAALIRQHGATSTRTEVIDAINKLDQLTGPPSSISKGKYGSNLEFPKTGVGVQCDINFSNHLALHNTQLLRCYSLCDPRVTLMVLCIKAWAKRRMINSSYRGTLSSYGYVLMVLHYLMNIAVPPVLPNLQLARRRSSKTQGTEELKIDGYNVQFWRDEEEIKRLAHRGELTRNQQSLGLLLRGFFDYYSHQGPRVIAYGFNWVTDVISIRTPGGILTKQAKRWIGAKTTTTVNEPTTSSKLVGKGVRHRYLFAIEDPFELDHNVARTVTHEGMYAIRYELRRVWRIICESGGRDSSCLEAIFHSIDVKQELEREKKLEERG
ncbi:MAG: hypothetical protein M1816_000419 [Peltula sp. TS41687]|nr:MAG: hypothetical protein M1816_000419 [Peltula sp. TS41687]